MFFGVILDKVKEVKKLSDLKRKDIKTLSLILSFLFTAWELYISNTMSNSKEFIVSFFIMIFSMFFILYPFIYFFRLKFRRFLSSHALFSIFLILYFILLIPILGIINYIFLNIYLGSFIIKLLHIISITVSMSLIVMIVSKQFIMLINKKRQINGIDLLTTFLTYIMLGLAFGSFYYILNLMASNNLFVGVDKPVDFNFPNFLNHIYISLGSLTTVGSGTISPINPYIRILCVFETISGIFLTSFSLGFIFSVLGSTIQPTSDENTNENNEIISKPFEEEISLYKSAKQLMKSMKDDLDKTENTKYF